MILLDVSAKRHSYDLPMAWLKASLDGGVARETMDSFRLAAKQEEQQRQQELEQSEPGGRRGSIRSTSNRSKRVQFAVPNHNDLSIEEEHHNNKAPSSSSLSLSPEECQELWYSKAEIQALRKDTERELLRHKNNKHSTICDESFCRRGLEDVCSLRAHMDKKARKAAAVRQLLQEQARQMASGCVNASTLAKRCTRWSATSKELARTLAQLDEEEAQAIYRETVSNETDRQDNCADKEVKESSATERTAQTGPEVMANAKPHAAYLPVPLVGKKTEYEEEEDATTVTTASLSLEDDCENDGGCFSVPLSPLPKSPRPRMRKGALLYPHPFLSPLRANTRIAPPTSEHAKIPKPEYHGCDLEAQGESSLPKIKYQHHSHHYDKSSCLSSPFHRSISNVETTRSNQGSGSRPALERGMDSPISPPPLALATPVERNVEKSITRDPSIPITPRKDQGSKLHRSSSSSRRRGVSPGPTTSKRQPRTKSAAATTSTNEPQDEETPRPPSSSPRKVYKVVRGQLCPANSPSIFSSPNSPFSTSRKIKARLVSSNHKKNTSDHNLDSDHKKNDSSHRTKKIVIDKSSIRRNSNSHPSSYGILPSRATSAPRSCAPMVETSAAEQQQLRSITPSSCRPEPQRPPVSQRSLAAPSTLTPSQKDWKVLESPKSTKTKLSINRATKQMVIEAVEG